MRDSWCVVSVVIARHIERPTSDTILRVQYCIQTVMPRVTVNSDNSSVTALVLVGLPASGKTTVREVLSDAGVEGIDVSEDSHRVSDVSTLIPLVKDKDDVPNILCVEGVTDEAQVKQIQNQVSEVCVVRVSAGQPDRLRRLVQRDVFTNDPEVPDTVSEETVADVITAVRSETSPDTPYPGHDIRFHNSNDVRSGELIERVTLLLDVVMSGRVDSLAQIPTDKIPSGDAGGISPQSTSDEKSVDQIAEEAVHSVLESR